MTFKKYENKDNMRIDTIRYSQTVYPFCEIGKENYVGELKVEMIPDKYIMDYIDEYQFIQLYNNSSYSGEVLVNDYFNHLVEEYHPFQLTVTLKANTSGHFPIEITRILK